MKVDEECLIGFCRVKVQVHRFVRNAVKTSQITQYVHFMFMFLDEIKA